MMSLKKMSKRFAVIAACIACIAGGSISAFAQSNENADSSTEATTETISEVVESKESSSDDNVVEEEDISSTDSDGEEGIDRGSLSVPGNATLKDDITDDGSTKEFLTIQTKNNQTFYVIIDRSSMSENVYMLSNIDEDDLQEFLKDADVENSNTGASLVITPDEVKEDTAVVEDTEKAEVEEGSKEKSNNNMGYLGIGLIAALGLGAAYYFKIYKKKNDDFQEEDEGLETAEAPEVDEDEEFLE